MNNSFVDDVVSIIGPNLLRRGFVVDEIDQDVDEGGRRGAVVYFRGPDCKLQVYWSAREREINCMVGPLEAPNEHGLYNRSEQWHYLNDFVPTPDIPLEELVKRLRSERKNFENQTTWLQWISERIDRYYDSALKGIDELNR